jgi:hypothetical protein
VPDEVISGCLVRIADVNDASASDASDTGFSIVPSGTSFITVTAPLDGEKWPVGSSRTIKWDFRGVNGVKIELSIDNGATWTEVAVNPANAANGTYAWTVPDLKSKQCLIRVSDTGGSSLPGMSGVFEIMQPELIITHTPITVAQENQRLTFSAQVTAPGEVVVDLHYSVTGARTFDRLVTMSKTGDNTYTCTLEAGIFTAMGIEYTITARDPDNVNLRASAPDKGFYCIRARAENLVSTYTVPGGSVQNAYRLISIPLSLDNPSVAGQFTSPPTGEMGPDWRLFRFSPGEAEPHEYPGIEGFTPGAL